MLRARERHATVEEARRAMVSAGYQLPPQCQPSPITGGQRRAPSPPTLQASHHHNNINNGDAMPAVVARRRHSISCSPVRSVMTMASPMVVPPSSSVEPPQVSHKRRFSFPAGDILSVPLTAFLPPEFKRRRVEAPSLTPTTTTATACPPPPLTSTAAAASTTTMALPTPQPVMAQALSPCLPPHTAATPDHLRLVPGTVSASSAVPSTTLEAFPLELTHKSRQMPFASSADLGNVAIVDGQNHLNANHAYTHYPVGPTSSPSSPGGANSSDGENNHNNHNHNNNGNSLTREEALAEKERKAQRVAEILDLMDRQNGADSPTSSSSAVVGSNDLLWSSADVRRRRVGKDQTGILDLVFKVEPMPGQAVKRRLADGLGMTYKQVQIWFQNKRARCKRAVEAPPRASHTFHNVLVSSDGRFMMKELAKGVHGSCPAGHYYEHHQPQLNHHSSSSYNHDASAVPAPPPLAAHLRSCILTQ